MAEAHDVVERSFNINSKLGPRLVAAAEQNAILRIGWTNAGEPVPKNGELGLCPDLPKGARMRALGVLGSWTAPFGSGLQFLWYNQERMLVFVRCVIAENAISIRKDVY